MLGSLMELRRFWANLCGYCHDAHAILPMTVGFDDDLKRYTLGGQMGRSQITNHNCTKDND
jgi:hypothetical protein